MTHNAPEIILYSSMSGHMTGGGQQSLVLLLKNLDRTRYAPILLCPGEGDLIAAARSLDIDTIFLPLPGLGKVTVSLIRKIVSLIKKYRVKLIHADHPRQAFCLGLAARLAGVPLIWHIRVADRGNYLYERTIYAFASKIIAVSGAAASRFGRRYKTDNKISIIYNAVDLSAFSPAVRGASIRHEFHLENKVVIGTMGQLLPRKGQDLFIRAAAEIIKRKKNDVAFMVVGTGDPDYTAYLKKLSTDLGLRDEIVFTGFRNDIPQLMASFDIFALATMYREGLSRVLIEAMAAGKPVVTTQLGGNTETVVDGVSGILIQPDNADALAMALVDLINDAELRASMGKAGRRLAEDRFDIKKNVEAVETVYAQLLSKSR